MSRITIHEASYLLFGLCLGRMSYMSYRWGWIAAAVVGVMALFAILARRRERRLRAQFDAEMKEVANRLCQKT